MMLSWQVLRESGKKKLHMVPHVFTLANAFFGFLAIINALHEAYITAIGCIMAAALMDALDGRMARMFGVSSSLGVELDSLCDAISFCLAPAFILYTWYLAEIGIEGVLVLALYLWCGLWRLARFNVAQATQYNYFTGLPTPMAALLVMSLMASANWFERSIFSFLVHPDGMLVLVGAIALLMVSRIKFPSFKKPGGIAPSIAVTSLALALFLGISALKGWPLLFFVFFVYVAWGVGVAWYAFIHSWLIKRV